MQKRWYSRSFWYPLKQRFSAQKQNFSKNTKNTGYAKGKKREVRKQFFVIKNTTLVGFLSISHSLNSRRPGDVLPLFIMGLILQYVWKNWLFYLTLWLGVGYVSVIPTYTFENRSWNRPATCCSGVSPRPLRVSLCCERWGRGPLLERGPVNCNLTRIVIGRSFQHSGFK